MNEGDSLVCKSEEEIRKYMKDKIIVVYAAHSFYDANEKQLVT